MQIYLHLFSIYEDDYNVPRSRPATLPETSKQHRCINHVSVLMEDS